MKREEILNMPAGREMDALIGEYVFGWKKGTFPVYEPMKSKHGDYIVRPIAQYSTDIAVAWEVVEWIQKNGYSFELTEHADPQGDYILQVWRRDMERDDFIARAETVPLAICRAALLAVVPER